MKKLNNMWSAFTFVVLSQVCSSGYAATLTNSVNTTEQVIFAGVTSNHSVPSSGKVETGSVAGNPNLLWVFGGALIGLSLVSRRLSV